MRRLAALATVVAAAALGASGCATTKTASSAGSFKGAESDVAKVVDDLRTAGERRDAAKICSEILARPLVTQLDSSGTSCNQEMAKTIKDVDDYAMTVRDVTVTGATATARVQNGAKGTTATFKFVREANRWKVSELAKG
jgi:hypothetical protein